MNIVLKQALTVILFFIVGYSLVILGWPSKFEPLIVGFLAIGFSIFMGVKMLSSFLRDPKNFVLNQQKKYKIAKVNRKDDKIVKFIDKNKEKERNMFLFIFKTPLIWGLYLCAFILTVLFFYSEFYLQNAFILKSLNDLFGIHSIRPGLGISLVFAASLFFLYSFIVLSILLIPYLILGEYYQKKIKHSSNNIFIEVLIDFIYSIPYLIIWSFLWVLFILTSGAAGNKNNRISTIKSISIFLSISAFSYWTYYSLAKIAFDDARVLFPAKNPITFYKEKGKSILAIWVRSGFYFAIPFFVSILAFGINIFLYSISVISKEMAATLFQYWGWYLGIPSLVFGIIGRIISSQLNLLNFYIKESENRTEDFVLDIK